MGGASRGAGGRCRGPFRAFRRDSLRHKGHFPVVRQVVMPHKRALRRPPRSSMTHYGSSGRHYGSSVRHYGSFGSVSRRLGCEARAFVVSHGGSVVRHRASVVSHGGSVVRHRASVVSHGGSVVRHRASVVCPAASVVRHRASGVCPETSVVRHRASGVTPGGSVVRHRARGPAKHPARSASEPSEALAPPIRARKPVRPAPFLTWASQTRRNA